jgi:hypothetical protein
MMVHSKSVRSNRRRVIRGLQIKASMNQIQADWQTPFMSALPSWLIRTTHLSTPGPFSEVAHEVNLFFDR